MSIWHWFTKRDTFKIIPICNLYVRDLDRLLQKRTAIVIAHRLATVEASDRILVLRRGELIEQGTHRELRARGGLYAQLADLQERGLARL